MIRNLTRLAVGYIAAAYLCDSVAFAQTTRIWNIASGNWSVAGNWNPAGVPANGDTVSVGGSAFGPNTITYDYAGPNLTLNSLSVSLLSLGGTTTLSMSSGNLITNDEYIAIGASGGTQPVVGSLVVTGGTNTINGHLYLGYYAADTGTYTLGGSAMLQSGYEVIGNFGAATFTQNSGTNTLTGLLDLAENSTSTAVYSLNGGALTANNQRIGVSGNGTLNQSGSSTNNVLSLIVGTFGSSTGTYRLGGAATVSLTEGYESIGSSGTGNFIQTAGTNQLNGKPMYIGENTFGNGTYSQSGGTLASGSQYVGYFGTGAFNQTGGANTITTGTLAIGHSTGATGSYTLSGGTLTAPAEFIGELGRATFTQSAGTNTVTNVGRAFVVGSAVGSTGTYNLSGTAVLTMSADEFIGDQGTGTFNHSGGSNTVFQLALGVSTGSNGTYTLSGGAITAQEEDVGEQGTGIFNHSAGTNTLGSGGLTLGYSANINGTYNLSGTGSLTASGTETVGFVGTGTFAQTGGSNTLSSGSVKVGQQSGATGSYTLSGGTLTAPAEIIGDQGTGTFTQSAGTNTVTDLGLVFLVGNAVGSSGTYNLSGTGVLTSSNEFIGLQGTGTFNQSGGSNTVFQLGLGSNAGSNGTYTLSGGTITAQEEEVGEQGTGICNQTGGLNRVSTSLSVGAFSFGNNPGIGSYTLSGGSLSVTDEVIGNFGNGTFMQSGGTHTINNSLSIGRSTNRSGLFALSGGSVSVTSDVFVGGYSGATGGTGVLTVGAGASITIGGSLTAFNTTGTAINFNGGTINAGNLNFNGTPSLFHWTTGTLNMTGGSVTWDSLANPTTTGAAFGSALTLNNGQMLQVVGFGDEALANIGPFSLTLNSGSTHTVQGDLFVNVGGVLTQNPGSTLIANSVTQNGGTINGTLMNQGGFIYHGGQFNGRLISSGFLTINASPASFTAASGVENDASMEIDLQQTLTANGQGFDNLGTFTLAGGTLSGNGPATNDFGGTMQAHGTVNSVFTNDGRLTVDGTLRFNGGATNYGILQGNGTVIGSVTNGIGGIIQPGTSPLAFTSFQGNNAGATIQIGAGLQLNIVNAWNNAGLVTLGGSTPGNSALLGGGTITNTGTVQGAGTVAGSVINSGGVLWAVGGELALAGGSNTNPATGQIQIDAGSKLRYLQGLATNAGSIELTGGTFDNNSHTLSNSGIINGYGTLRTSGLTIVSGGAISVGGGDLNLLGNVTNNGAVSIQNGKSAYFYGNVNGAGNYTGTGTAVYLAGFSPGNSPASVTFGGSVNLTSSSTLQIEIGGTSVATQYDQLNVTGQLSLGGTLQVSLINGFTPPVGQSFHILQWGSLSGTFSSVQLPAQQGSLHLVWNQSPLYTSGSVQLSRAYYEVQSGTYGDNFSGAGVELIKTTSATATITGNSSFSGGTTVEAGTLVVGNQNALGTGGLTIGSLATAKLQAGLTAPVQLSSLMIGGADLIGVTDYDLWSKGLERQGGPLAADENTGTVATNTQPIPEPPSIILTCFAAGGLAVRRRFAANTSHRTQRRPRKQRHWRR